MNTRIEEIVRVINSIGIHISASQVSVWIARGGRWSENASIEEIVDWIVASYQE